jgi:hypothetical protein
LNGLEGIRDAGFEPQTTAEISQLRSNTGQFRAIIGDKRKETKAWVTVEKSGAGGF